MLNINELEHKWLKYKIKSYIPHVVIIVSSLLIIVLLYILINSNYFKSDNSDVKSTPIITEATVTIENKQKEEPVQAAIIMKTKQEPIPVSVSKSAEEPLIEQKLLIAPSMNFIKNIQHDNISYNSNSHSKNQTSTSVQKVETPRQSAPAPEFIEEIVLKQPIQVEETKILEEETKVNTISIKRQNEYSDIEEIITRFKKNNNPALSLFIAKKYYELGEYRNAYNYALITNELNKDIEASLIIFAKALVKLNEKDKAVKVLQGYIKHSNSNRANLLLNEILSGKFK